MKIEHSELRKGIKCFNMYGAFDKMKPLANFFLKISIFLLLFTEATPQNNCGRITSEKLYYLPRNVLQSDVYSKNLIDNIHKDCEIFSSSFGYLIWDNRDNIIWPPCLESKVNNELKKRLEFLYAEKQPWEESSMVLLSNRDMALAYLEMVKEHNADNLRHLLNGIPKEISDIKAFLYQKKATGTSILDFLPCKGTNIQHGSNELSVENTNKLSQQLNIILQQKSNKKLKFMIQGHFQDLTLTTKLSNNESKNLISRHLDGELIIGRTGHQRNRITLNPLNSFDHISGLLSEEIIFNDEVLFRTNMLEDLLEKSTVEKSNGDASFLLGYFKTGNFDRASSDIAPIERQLQMIRQFIEEEYSNVLSDVQLNIEITGFADTTGFDASEIANISNSKSSWVEFSSNATNTTQSYAKNDTIARKRAENVRTWFEENFDRSKISGPIFTAKACKAKYFISDDRSVQIKVWISDKNKPERRFSW